MTYPLVFISAAITKLLLTSRKNRSTSREEIAALASKNYLKFSRIPVYAEKPENIKGYVFRQTVFEKLAEDRHDLTLRDIKRVLYIHDI